MSKCVLNLMNFTDGFHNLSDVLAIGIALQVCIKNDEFRI